MTKSASFFFCLLIIFTRNTDGLWQYVRFIALSVNGIHESNKGLLCLRQNH